MSLNQTLMAAGIKDILLFMAPKGAKKPIAAISAAATSRRVDGGIIHCACSCGRVRGGRRGRGARSCSGDGHDAFGTHSKTVRAVDAVRRGSAHHADTPESRAACLRLNESHSGPDSGPESGG